MIRIDRDRLLDLIKKEFISMVESTYVDSSTIFLGQVEGIEFTITLSRDEDDFFEDVGDRRPIIISATKPTPESLDDFEARQF